MRIKMRLIAVLLVLICTISPVAYASTNKVVSSRASAVFQEYGIGISAKANGKIVVTAEVNAVDIADKLGFPTVQIRELQDSGTWRIVQNKKARYVYDDIIHMVTVTFYGTVGKTYKGYASYYGKIGAKTDTASLESNPKVARD